MAEAALSTLLQSAFDGLCSLIREGFGLIWGLHKDIENLRSTLSSLLAVLADAEKKQLKDEALKNWLAKLKYVAYDIEDILDQWTTEERELETQGHIAKKARTLFSVSNISFRSSMAHKIKDVNERLEAIAGERSKFHLIEGARMFETEDRRKTDSFVIESDVLGRNEDKESLIKTLLDAGREGEISVIPIVGMGGLGKTTLAQLIYNDRGMKAHFDLRIWVCVSDNFDLRRLTKAILESATDRKCEFEDEDMLQCRLQEKLKGWKFLLVLDDVWEENPNNWERLKGFLRAGAIGSKIIVTTRSEMVASIMGSLPPHHLGRLSDEDCWILFKQRAFEQVPDEKSNLIAIGKDIVKKCGGVPLAAKAIGSLMRFKTEERQWEFIKENEFWNLPKEGNGILPALRLSYYQLPPHLKQCFAYCSIFPKDHEINTKELILLWMAEGFIQPTQGAELLEDVGRECFHNLLWRSFFQEPEKDDDGNIVSCKMHDLMHDLALSVSGDAYSVDVNEGNIAGIPEGCRHLSLVGSFNHKSFTVDFTASNIAEKLRTLLILTFGTTALSHNFHTHLPCLRVLNLSHAIVTKEMLNSISPLKQLRYVHLVLQNDVRSLPESFTKLRNLQTLRLTDSYGLEELPRAMRRMTSLRRLQLIPSNSLTHMPANMGELKYLQTLSVFIVGKESGCNVRELQDLKLGGELTIRNLENVRGRENAAEAKLNEKANLRSLTFSWSGGDIDADMRGCSAQTLQGLQPHPNLKCLTLKNYVGERFPDWMASMANLNRVSLNKCRRCEQLPPLGQLPLLKSLHIKEMDTLKRIGISFYGDRAFPSLVDLTLKKMPNLEEWSSESQHPEPLPRLEKLTFSRCPKLAAIPCFPSLSSLTIENFEGESLPVDLFQNQNNLPKLWIRDCGKLKSLPRELGNLAALQELWIEFCDGLTCFRLQGRFTSLQSLNISYCRNLVSMAGDMHYLTALENLDIEGCPELGSLPEDMEHLTSLKSLSITSCDKVTCLLEGLKHVSTLQHLKIVNLRRLAALPEWIGNIPSLRSLFIWSCDNLVSLPSGLQNLTNLQSLSVGGCPQLRKRCKRETGEDWHKIAHIPSIQIDD